jgi:hypothetical protein
LGAGIAIAIRETDTTKKTEEMKLANSHLFQSLKHKSLPQATAINNEQAPAYVFTPKHQLAQYAATGCNDAGMGNLQAA